MGDRHREPIVKGRTQHDCRFFRFATRKFVARRTEADLRDRIPRPRFQSPLVRIVRERRRPAGQTRGDGVTGEFGSS